MDGNMPPFIGYLHVNMPETHKARLVMGEHVTTADDLDKYTATINLDGVELQLFLTARLKRN